MRVFYLSCLTTLQRNCLSVISHLEVGDPRGKVAVHSVVVAVHGLRVQPNQGRGGGGHGRAERSPEQAALLGIDVRQEGAQFVVDGLTFHTTIMWLTTLKNPGGGR